MGYGAAWLPVRNDCLTTDGIGDYLPNSRNQFHYSLVMVHQLSNMLLEPMIMLMAVVSGRNNSLGASFFVEKCRQIRCSSKIAGFLGKSTSA